MGNLWDRSVQLTSLSRPESKRNLIKKKKKREKRRKKKKKGTSYNLNSSNMSSLTRQMVCYTELSENLFLETDKRALLEFFLIGDWINHLSVIIITGWNNHGHVPHWTLIGLTNCLTNCLTKGPELEASKGKKKNREKDSNSVIKTLDVDMQTGCLQQYCRIHLIWLDQYDLVWVRSQVT